MWGMITFFMEGRLLRSILSCLILVIILSSNTYIWLNNYHILLSFVLLIIISGFLHANLSKPIYHLFVSFTLMIGYTGILLWKQSTSLWLFIPEFIFIPMLCSILVFSMIKGLYHRLMISIFGFANGEVLHGFILSSYHLPITIGDLDFFVKLYMIILLLLLLHIFQKGKMQLHALLSSWYKTLKGDC